MFRHRKSGTAVSRRRLLMEGLEQRQLLAGGFDTDIPYLTGRFVSPEARSQYVDSIADNLEQLRDNRTQLMNARGGGGGGLGGSNPRGVTESSGNNDSTGTAQDLTLGTAPGRDPALTLSGSYQPIVDQNGFSRTTDADYYRLTLRGGDILSARIDGGTNLVLYDGNDLYRNDGDLLMFSTQDQGRLSFDSPLLFGGDANLSYVIPKTGTYFIATTGSFGQYVMDLRVFRPTLEAETIGTSQILFLDFDGELLLPNEQPAFTPEGRPVFLEGLAEFMPNFGFRDSDADRMIDLIVENVVDKFDRVGLHATNGFFQESGIPGEYGIQILNSRDHGNMWGLPNVMRIIVGGSIEDTGGLPILGLAEHIDVGNFVREDTGVVYVEPFVEAVAAVPRAPTVTDVQIASWAIGSVVVHEAGHLLGLWHTIATAQTLDVIATTFPDGLATDAGDGRDGIVGTDDDEFPQFLENRLDVNAAAVDGGYVSSRDWVSWVLATGKVGGTVSGTIFEDANRNGVRGTGESGLGGITVFSDTNGNGVLDGNEPRAVTANDGTYSLLVAPGQHVIRAVLPVGFVASTPNPQTVTLSANGGATATFGATRVNADITGFKWNDLNGNGLRDPGEPGIAGVYVYLDLDGDDRLDLFEPKAVTDEDGSYSLNFPGPGTYTIREVVAPGFSQTFPPTGEHTVVYNGSLLTDNYNFGNRSVRDFGDAPNTGIYSFPTTGSNAASAGIVPGLSLGLLIDAEADGQPSLGADGDDNNGVSDEDGVTLRSALAPGSPALFDVFVTNTTGNGAYLSAWIDLNGNGNWNDAGEKFATDVLVNTTGTYQLPLAIPASTPLGNTYARFRLSQSPGVGAGGFTAGGEVEDYRFTIAETPELANDDTFDVPRGALSFPLNVLANDFDPSFDPLIIEAVNTSGTRGQVIISQDRRRIFYTPASNSIGPDSFVYTVSNSSGTQSDTATVNLNVTFQSAVPIAVDDSFDIPQGFGNQPLNVLANDVVSVAEGGLRIISTTAGSANGTIQITPGGQSIRYTPAAGFSGTEQFRYTVSDTAGQVSSAEVTVHLQPGARTDDLVNFIVETFANDGVTPINTIPAGERFKLRVSVDDLRGLTGIQGAGLSAAYLDLLYTDGLVSTVAASAGGSGFSFEVSFGPLFTVVRTGDALTPGILNEMGATQSGLGTAFTGSAELFTITMLAVSPGIAEFVADPADELVSDVVLLNDPSRELTPSEIRFGRRQLTIVPSNSNFTFAVDDSYPDQLDSNNSPIVAGSNARLNVLANDNRGPSGVVEIVSVGAAASGSVSVNDNGTPFNTSDDYLVYRANPGFVGVDQFTYTIVSGDGIQSTAQVTVTVGNAAADDLVDIQLNVTDLDGNEFTDANPLMVGQQFNLDIFVSDLRAPAFGQPRGVFAAYMDLLYNSTLAQPAPPAPDNAVGQRLGFEVEFGDQFSGDPAVGDDLVPGLINEFGTFQVTAQGSGDPLQSNPVLLATVTMVALAPGNLRIVADPADVSPFQDTLLFEPPDVVPISRIRYDVANVRISTGGGSGEGEAPFQNARNRMDVNNDGVVSPIDALLVLNRLNRGGEGEGGNGSDGNGTQIFWDVNGDNRMSPIDALQVINFLNRGNSAGVGEGESAMPIGDSFGSNSVAGFASAADAVFGEIGGGEGEGLIVGGSSAQASSNFSDSASASLVDTDSEDDEEQSDDLSLLADNS